MTEEDQIQKGFNAGYQLAQLKPELATQLAKSFKDQTHPYALGFRSGREQFTQEQTQEKSSFKDRYFQKIKQQAKSNTKGKDKSPDKGMDL